MTDENNAPTKQPSTLFKPDLSRCLSAKDVAAHLSVSVDTARIELRNMPGAFRVGVRWRITRVAFERWLLSKQEAQEWHRSGESARRLRDHSSWVRPIVPRTKPRTAGPPSGLSRTQPTLPRTKPR